LTVRDDNVPAPPAGFTLDTTSDVPAPPQGFTLDARSQTKPPAASAAPSLGTRIRAGVDLGARLFSQDHPIMAGVGETALKAGSQMLANPIEAAASLYHLATDEPGTKVSGANEAVQSIADATTYQPRTAPGRAFSSVADTLGSLIPNASNRAGQYVTEKTGSTALGAATALAPQAALSLAGARAGEPAVRAGLENVARSGEQAATAKAAELAPKNASIEQARSIGLKLPPSQAGGGVGKIMEGIGGKTANEMDMSRANAAVINRTVAKDIGLSANDSLTEAKLEELKQRAYKPYEAIKKAGKVTADDEYRTALEQVKERTAQASEDFPEDTNELIEKEIGKFNRPSADAGSWLEKVKSLRERASKNMKATDAEKFELGIAQKKIATSIEDLLDRQIGTENPGLISEFRGARQRLAKIYSVQDAVSPNGNVSAAVLSRQLDRGVPLSGGLKTVAELYQQFPKVMRHVEGLGGHSPFSALDYLVAGVAGLTELAGGNFGRAATVAGALAARPTARAIIRSGPYQRAAIKPRIPRPSMTSRVARQLAGPDDPNTLAGLSGGVSP
jgi:hypothetical protein